jgi:2-polyprenyl-3-methyl-5-hydroxy-6-metoxy-1,4-benzoquinol methylase
MELHFGENAFDVIVTLEALSHVAHQRAFVGKRARHSGLVAI